MKNLDETIKSMNGLKIMVVGDLMLDTFVYGDVERISPESPVPVLAIRTEDRMLGGAGNVLSNLCALGVTPSLFASVGQDANADVVENLAKAMGADTKGLLRDASRPTTLKTRYLARHQHLLRTDVEKTHPLSDELNTLMFAAIKTEIKSVRAVVLSDYGKGVLGTKLLADIIALANASNVPVLVDPKGDDYSLYRGADYVTPNRQELAQATGSKNLKTDAEITDAAQKIIKTCGIACVIATRSEDGMSVIDSKKPPVHLKTNALEVFDVSGAGDTVIATLAAALASGASIEDAAVLANLAGGIAVSKVGTTPVRGEELLTVLERRAAQSPRMAPLDKTIEAIEHVRQWQAKGLKVGFTNGCFDILHKGHVTYLDEARNHCDRLVVALNHDASVRLLKGPARPINDETARAAVIGALACVDLVVLFGARKAGEDNTPCALLEQIKPDLYFKGGDYTIDQLPEAKIVHAYGGEVRLMGLEEGFSTTGILAKSSQKTGT